ncbi:MULTISPECIES: Crp/Fnr family transcriptional regulator [Bacteroidota]|jgi:CRP-like cAMP-binding protein|uniref:Crp/Fnr family transcriptional regulator n=1 Tax=Bacteroidota TaxID=976 RepID=UPI00241F3F85|nr:MULTISPECIES: Crp/Fnr family transcriptional regulator [Bacteroidota]
MSTESQFLEQFIQHFKETIKLNESEEDLIVSNSEVYFFKKKSFILQPGDVSHYMRYIAKGSVRVYQIDLDGQEHTLQLGIENWWVNDLYSYLSGKESKMFIQAVEETVLVQVDKTKLEMLLQHIPHLSNFFRIKLQNAYVVLQERTVENLSMDSYEKYTKFRKEYRILEQRFPQYIIASYLGMTPQFLSYLRKKHSI